MTLHISVDPADSASAARVLTPDLWQPPVAELMKSAADIAVRTAQDGARGLGGIPSSIGAQVTPLGAKVSTSAPGALAMESGRRAGAKLPPVEALSRYGGVAFLIARAIAKRGIRGRFYMRKAYDTLDRSELPRLIKVAQEQIAARWAQR